MMSAASSVIVRTIDALTMVGVAIAGFSMAALVILGASEVVLRNAFGISMPIVLEYNGYLLACAFLGGAGRAVREGGHIRVTMLSGLLAEKQARLLDILCTLVGTLLAGCMAFGLYKLAWGSFSFSTVSFYPSRTPLAVPQGLAFAMAVIFVLAIIARLIRLLAHEAPDLVSTNLTGDH